MACMVAEIAAAELDAAHERIAGRFARAEPRSGVIFTLLKTPALVPPLIGLVGLLRHPWNCW